MHKLLHRFTMLLLGALVMAALLSTLAQQLE